eukprot:5378364-Prymnesium_polylepis.1
MGKHKGRALGNRALVPARTRRAQRTREVLRRRGLPCPPQPAEPAATGVHAVRCQVDGHAMHHLRSRSGIET